MAATPTAFACTEADCSVRRGEPPCKLGHPIAECPNARAVDVEARVAAAEPASEPGPPPESTHHGAALTWAEAGELARSSRATVVLVAALEGWGKTTLITAILEAFQAGPVGDLRFAGSRTLVGFEERRHDTRTASGRVRPRVERTYRGSDSALHLDVCRETQTSRLLLADIPGERFEAVRDRDDAVTEVPLLDRADHLVLLVDGAGLSDDAARHLTRHSARTVLQVLLNSGKLPGHAQVQIVVTKSDLLASEDEPFTTETTSTLQQTAMSAGRTVEVIRTAALSPVRGGVVDEGVQRLLSVWTSPPRPWACRSPRPAPEERARRSFVRFALAGVQT